MRITGVGEQTVPIPSSYRTAGYAFDSMTASVLVVSTDAVRDGKPVHGLAFDSIGRYGHGGLLRERFIPRLMAADPAEYDDGRGGIDPARAWTILMRNEKPGGHGDRAGAVGLLDCALWDLAAKLAGQPLWRLLADRYGHAPAHQVAVYASGGHYRDQDDAASLHDDIQRAMQAGHDHFKIKIGGLPLADDLARIDAARALLGPGRLAVDGNGCLPPAQAHGYAQALAGADLAWFEEPVDPLDYQAHAAIAAAWPGALATGENLFSAADLRNLLRHGGLRPSRDLLQIDISLSYGITDYARLLDLAAGFGWARDRFSPHAGHLLALQAVAGFGLGRFELAADQASPFGALPTGMQVQDGHLPLTSVPGVGFEATPALAALFKPLLP